MTRKKNFGILFEKLAKLVEEHQDVPDVLLMKELGFSPTGWKTWKSKFIENCLYSTKTKKGQDSVEYIEYNKKRKHWEWKSRKKTDSEKMNE